MEKTLKNNNRKLEEVKLYITQGFTVKKSCEKVGIGRSTFYKHLSSNKEFKDSFYQELDSRVFDVEDSLYKQAITGNTTAIIFFLTNRAKDRWKHKSEIDLSIQKAQQLKSVTDELEPLQKALGISNPFKFNNKN